MSKPFTNPTIGQIPCAQRNCSLIMEVKKYASRTDDPKLQRYTGKLYAVCPAGHRTNDQDYILDHPGAVSGAPAAPPETVAAPALKIEKTPQNTADLKTTASPALDTGKSMQPMQPLLPPAKKGFFSSIFDDDKPAQSKPQPTIFD